MSRHYPVLSDREKDSIAKAIASGLPIAHLHRSGRYRGVSMRTLAAIADAKGVPRKRQPGKDRQQQDHEGPLAQ